MYRALSFKPPWGRAPHSSVTTAAMILIIFSDLAKALTLSDLTFLAIGSMIGSGLYVLTGEVARHVAGPSIVISYAIAAVASGFSAVCYAGIDRSLPDELIPADQPNTRFYSLCASQYVLMQSSRREFPSPDRPINSHT